MRVLVTLPPHVPSYFNAGHHLPVFTVAADLRKRNHAVDTLDAGALNTHWRAFGERLHRGAYDAVVIVNEFDHVEGVRRAADYTRALLPDALIVTVGRLSYQVPGFFRTLDLDAIVSSGDYETGVALALEWHEAGRTAAKGLAGVSIRTAAGWLDPDGPGRWAPADQWTLPDISEIPYDAYDRMYQDDRNKFCGVPLRRELVVPVARGCPVGCSFCDVPAMQGLRERRISVERALAYIKQSFETMPFEYVAFYAPTFTLDRAWVRRLCAALREEPRRYPWKCATTLHHLDATLIAEMAEAGCERISVGVETFEDVGRDQMPALKRCPQDRFAKVAEWCQASKVELNCFIIVGLPGTTARGAMNAIAAVGRANARARPTLYTPYEQMRPDMSERELSAFNRQLFVDPVAVRQAGHDPGEFLDIVFGDDGYVTPATDRIPGRSDRIAVSG
jgi:anaerobic magnesium-protoporphyrin IX monomethyl ester cyclase